MAKYAHIDANGKRGGGVLLKEDGTWEFSNEELSENVVTYFYRYRNDLFIGVLSSIIGALIILVILRHKKII